MSEQAYFEQFSGHDPTDDTWWDLWAVASNSFSYGEYRTEERAEYVLKAVLFCAPRLKDELQIIHIEQAGFGDAQYKGLGMRIWMYGVYLERYEKHLRGEE